MDNKKVEKEIEECINANIKEIKKTSVEINNGYPIFSKKDYQITEGKPTYFELDDLR